MIQLDRTRAIMDSAEAVGRQELAHYLAHALGDSVTVLQAKSILAAAPCDMSSVQTGAEAMKRTLEQMGVKRAVTSTGLTPAPAARADAKPEDVEARMSLADRARQMYGR